MAIEAINMYVIIARIEEITDMTVLSERDVVTTLRLKKTTTQHYSINNYQRVASALKF